MQTLMKCHTVHCIVENLIEHSIVLESLPYLVSHKNLEHAPVGFTMNAYTFKEFNNVLM